ncbi:hypothetical protein PRIPAC_75352 [Pristionchus pacificus]|uniref:Apple domain-containing protein n=1 Tax=Pristionchus pacificus TaxID=54126 RepID=A0A2A6C5D7_PRIPA|nr:hypothetical protein PRIPAC_75352 [Pristionchus pacificus]|eukprot:PDM73432.1 hypothetical protein PRIPAC_40788 [Pristionchus pacificus]
MVTVCYNSPCLLDKFLSPDHLTLMLASLLIIVNFVSLAACSCFTVAPWDTYRSLVADIFSTPSLDACQDACLQNDQSSISQCAAASYSTISTCALLGVDTRRTFACRFTSGTLYVRDPTCTDCPTPVYVDPGCNAVLHLCTEATRNEDTLECATGSQLYLTDTNEATDPLSCVGGEWKQRANVYPPNTAVYCMTCANAVFGDPPAYNPDDVTPTRSPDGLSYTCPSPYYVWLAYHPDPANYNSYFFRRTTTFECQPASGYYWNTPGNDLGPQPTAMIKDWVDSGCAYDIGCAVYDFR